jgi:hypothetical protein
VAVEGGRKRGVLLDASGQVSEPDARYLHRLMTEDRNRQAMLAQHLSDLRATDEARMREARYHQLAAMEEVARERARRERIEAVAVYALHSAGQAHSEMLSRMLPPPPASGAEPSADSLVDERLAMWARTHKAEIDEYAAARGADLQNLMATAKDRIRESVEEEVAKRLRSGNEDEELMDMAAGVNPGAKYFKIASDEELEESSPPTPPAPPAPPGGGVVVPEIAPPPALALEDGEVVAVPRARRSRSRTPTEGGAGGGAGGEGGEGGGRGDAGAEEPLPPQG